MRSFKTKFFKSRHEMVEGGQEMVLKSLCLSIKSCSTYFCCLHSVCEIKYCLNQMVEGHIELTLSACVCVRMCVIFVCVFQNRVRQITSYCMMGFEKNQLT